MTRYFTLAPYPIRPIPFSITATTAPPSTASSTLPLPPNRLVPPMTAAPTAYSRTELPPVFGSTELALEAATMPPIAAIEEQITNALILIRSTGMPARLAASVLPPTAYRWRPNPVRRSTSVHTTSSTRMIGTTIGTPVSETSAGLRLRSRLSAATASPAKSASMPTRKAISDSGSATRPRLARFLARLSCTPAKIATHAA